MKQFNLEEYLKDPSKKVVTRSGKNTRIICTDAKNVYSVVALIAEDKSERVETYLKDGRYSESRQSSDDLFFAPEKYERWVNLYKDNNGIYASINTFKTKEEAEALSCSSCIATVKVEWEE